MCNAASAQIAAVQDSSDVQTVDGKTMREVTVSARKAGRVKTSGLGNTEFISSRELLRAACCNLGESFTTNPSVDVNYADAATGAQQIKLLGLSGTYVQMLTENIPNYRGLAAPTPSAISQVLGCRAYRYRRGFIGKERLREHHWTDQRGV